MISIIIKDFNNCYNKIYMLNKRSQKFKFMSKTLIIAEAGVNHNGNLKLAKINFRSQKNGCGCN